MFLAVYIGINVEYYGRGQAGFSYPLLSLTGLVSRYYRLRQQVRTVTNRLSTAASLLSIGCNALAWATVGGSL